MANFERVRARIIVQPPRGVVIAALAVLSWALLWSAGNVVATSFRFIAGA